ncbi:hypothetical protein [Blastococcus sp. Marseille-P5729]|uniref:hypothetical protein n=1 Tax=Blastococcus sp. Marseille-P5729 TaxID=2086582 RepID=UPI00131B8DF0|nr:hypothetical protein [Blastococcus sp. Marseille-P5729]
MTEDMVNISVRRDQVMIHVLAALVAGDILALAAHPGHLEHPSRWQRLGDIGRKAQEAIAPANRQVVADYLHEYAQALMPLVPDDQRLG